MQLQYNWHSCIMGSIGFILPRLVIGVFVQFLCSFITLPLNAIVTHMGSSFKKAIFDEHVQEGLVGWAQKPRRKNARKSMDRSTMLGHTHRESSSITSLKMSNAGGKESEIEDVESQSMHPASMQSPVNEMSLLMGSK